MAVSVKELKEILANTIATDFISEGFSFNKSEFTFKKKIEKSIVECVFYFYNYSPNKVEFNFTFTFLLKELEDELRRFYIYSGGEYRKGKGIYIIEGDFHPDVANEIRKYRVAHTHIITDFRKDYQYIEEARQVLKNQFFPRVPIFTNLQNFQKFILEDYDRVIKHGFILYALLALKLIGKKKASSLLEYIAKSLQIEKLGPIHSDRKLVENFSTYIE